MPEHAENESTLIFDWSKPRRQTARLAFWMVVTALGLAAFFILFRVVYQAPRHFIPPTNHILLLNPADPAARALLQRVADKDFFVFSNNEERKGGVSLEEQSPLFHPSFEKHELKLQDLPRRDTKPPPVRLMDFTAPDLPNVDLGDLHNPVATTAPVGARPSPALPELHLSGALAGRKILTQPDLSSLPPLDYAALRFQLGVDADGRVTFALPLTTTEKPGDAAPLLHLLQGVRFAPVEKSPVPVWGIATIAWAHAAAP